jgi:hypothetical protein
MFRPLLRRHVRDPAKVSRLPLTPASQRPRLHAEAQSPKTSTSAPVKFPVKLADLFGPRSGPRVSCAAATYDKQAEQTCERWCKRIGYTARRDISLVLGRRSRHAHPQHSWASSSSSKRDAVELHGDGAVRGRGRCLAARRRRRRLGDQRAPARGFALGVGHAAHRQHRVRVGDGAAPVSALADRLGRGVMAAAARRNRAPAKKLDIAVLEAWDRRSLRRHSGPQRDEQVLVETQVHAQAVSREGRGEHVRPKRQSNSHGFRRRWMRAAPPPRRAGRLQHAVMTHRA